MFKYLRILVPSWRFFNDTGAVPKLYVRVIQPGQLDGGGWLAALTPPKLTFMSLFVNAEGNFYHATCNALDQLLRVPDDKDAAKIVHTYIIDHLLRVRGVKEPVKYQFKVTVLQFMGGEAMEEDSLVSQEVDL